MGTLNECFAQYEVWMSRRGKAPASIRSYHYTYKQFCKQGFSTLNDQTCEQYVLQFENKATRNKKVAHLRAFTSWYLKQAEHDPALVRHLTIQQEQFDLGIPEVLEQDESTKLLASINGISEVAGSHATLMLLCGLRFGEAYKITTQHITTFGDTSCLRFYHKGKERIVPLSSRSLVAAQVWAAQNKKLSSHKLYRIYRRVRKETGVSFVPHHFRHSFASKARASGADYSEIADFLGNSVEVCRRRYARIDILSLKRLAEE